MLPLLVEGEMHLQLNHVSTSFSDGEAGELTPAKRDLLMINRFTEYGSD